MTTSLARARAADLARRGEQLAERHLGSLGMQVVERNWRCPAGEVDLVLWDEGELVICEVKTRRGLGFGEPVEAVTATKLARLRRLAGAFLESTALRPRGVRIDVVGIHWPDGGRPQLRHVRGVQS